MGMVTAVKARAPVLGGNFGVWGGLFSTFDCAVKGIRKKEDPYNASTYPLPSTIITKYLLVHGSKPIADTTNTVTAGFLTGGSLAIRGGFKAARNSAIGCGILLAVIEGVGIGFQRMFAGNTKLEAPLPPPAASEQSGRAAMV